MKGINKAIIVGHLGADPEVRYTADSKAITNIRVATSESWKDKQTGEKQERTEWHRVVFFGKTAEIAGEYLSKGALVYIEGSIRTRKWQDKSGKDCYSTEIVVEGYNGEFQMLGGRDAGERTATAAVRQETQTGFRQPPAQQPAPAEEKGTDWNEEQEIPF